MFGDELPFLHLCVKDGASTVPMSHAFSHPVKWSIFKWHHTVKEGIWIKSRNGACDGMSSTCSTLESDFFLQVDHTIVSISARIILYIMLDHLGICRAIYRRRMYSQNKSVWLCFSTLLSKVMGYVFCTVQLPSNALLSLQSLYVQMTWSNYYEWHVGVLLSI